MIFILPIQTPTKVEFDASENFVLVLTTQEEFNLGQHFTCKKNYTKERVYRV